MKIPCFFSTAALLAVFSSGVSPSLSAEERKPVTESNYTLAERFTPAKVSRMVHSMTVVPRWIDGTDSFWYSYETSDGTFWWIVDCRKGTKKELFDRDYMAAELTKVLKDPYDGKHLPPISPRFSEDGKRFRFTVRSKWEESEELDRKSGRNRKVKKAYVFEYDLQTGKLGILDGYKATLPHGWANVSPDGNHVVYVKDYNLWYMDGENYAKAMVNEKDSTIVERQLTFDGELYNGYGYYNTRSDDDAEKLKSEKKRIEEVVWSPDSRHFVVKRWDQRNIKDLWVIDYTADPRPALHTYRYQMPGEPGGISHLEIFDTENFVRREVVPGGFSEEVVNIVPDEEEFRLKRKDYATLINRWLGGPGEFYITRLSRDFKNFDTYRVDVETLSLTPVIKEHFNKFLDSRTMRLTDGQSGDMIYWSEEDGWAHLYRYGRDGNLVNRITSGPWHVDEIVGVDPANETVYFVANGREEGINPYYEFLYSVKFDGTGLKLLTPGDANHKITMLGDNRYFIDNASRVDMAPEATLYRADGKKIMELEKADLSKLFESGYRFPERFTVKAADGITDLYGVMYTPYDLDTTRLYPIIEYVYPGPQQEGVQYSYMEPRGTLDRLAQLGFIVVTVGNRGGHPARSKWYHTYGYGDLRDYGLADKKTAAIQLADRYPFMDITRVGITGHSGGGFMSTAAILKYPEFFKVAVSCAGNHDNAIYNRMWGEKYQGVKEVVSSGDTTYRFSVDNNEDIAKNLQGRLLLVTGDVDNNVHPGNTMRVVEQLIRAGKRFDMLVLPGQTHSFGDMSNYFFWRMADYFCRYLIGDCEDTVDIPQLRE